MRSTFVAVLVVGLGFGAASVMGQDGTTPPESAQEKTTVFHFEPFLALGNEFSGDENHFTGGFDFQLGLGNKRWQFCSPYEQCSESDGPRLALLGLGLGISDRGMEARFPLLTIRIIRNAWVGTAVTLPIAWREPGAPRTPGFSVTLSIAHAKDWWED